MSAPAPALAGYASEASHGPRLRLIPAIETYPKVVAFAQTPAGKVAIAGAFILGYGCFLPQPAEWLMVALSIALITAFPNSRWKLVAFGTLAVTVVQPGAPYLLAVVALGVLLFSCARRWPQSGIGRRPVATLLAGFTLLILGCCLIPRQSAAFFPAWTVIGALSKYVWFIGYALMDRTKSPRNGLPLQAGSLQPFWGSTSTPFPKGAAYLRRIEAHDPEQLAVTQLKGIKLLAWALMLLVFQRAWMFAFHTYLHIPFASQAMAMSVQRTPYPWYVCWVSQVLAFFEFLLELSIFGHQFIAGCRVAGFNALRNTCRPLSSTTIIDFFNRFYFYFKELLVEFFFFPTFLRYFKRHRRLRVVAATFAAATFGNMFFHFTRDYWMIARDGLPNALVNFQVYAFYCVVLGAALSISQLRRRPPRSGFVRGRLLPATWVVLFYCLLDVFGSTARNYPLSEHFRFLGHLFGIHV